MAKIPQFLVDKVRAIRSVGRTLLEEHERELFEDVDELLVRHPRYLALKNRVALLERHKAEFFDVIERIERQRDEWRDIHKESVGKYHVALEMLERELRRERVRNAKLLVHVNKLREDKKLDPIKTPRHLDRELGLDADPVGLAKQYDEAVTLLLKEGAPESRRQRKLAGEDEDRPDDVDGVGERDELRRKHAEEDGGEKAPT